MEPIDICYTPLDMPERPDIDIQKFLDWAKRVYPQLAKDKAKHSEAQFNELYPWDLVFGCFDGEWQDNFDKEFPELAEYCYNAFGIRRMELATVVFLPVRPHVQGISFWHSDMDGTGFRFYLECENHDKNPLVVRKTVNPNNELAMLSISLDEDHEALQKEVYRCNMISPHQSFYINNYRAVHAPMMDVPALRIAGFVTVRPFFTEMVKKRTRDLIVRSAEKYKDYAILW